MQLIDVDDVSGVRAAVVTFMSEASSVRFVLVPDMPLGEPAHYEALRETLHSCDLVAAAAPACAPRWAKVRALEWNPQWHRLGRGRRIRLVTGPDSWDGVDRPFIAAPSVPATVAASRDARQARKPLWLVPLEPIRPLMVMIVSRYVTRVFVGYVLAAHARQALGPIPSGLAFLDADFRYRAAQLGEVVRQVHAERHDQTLRVAVVAQVGEMPGVARALGGLGYSPDEIDWMTVFPWLPGDTPTDGPRPYIEGVVKAAYQAP
jgi:hypothetical protein